jgi:hypothetical protein
MPRRKSPRKRSPKKSPRKGVVLTASQVESSTRSKVRALEAKHGGVTEVRGYANGTVGAFFADGQFRFVRGANNIQQISRSPRRVNLSNKAAKGLFTKYYNKKSYKSANRRKAAMKRDHCTKNVAHTVSDTRWARNPGKYDLVGFDDGSNCESEVRNSRRPPSSQIDAALKKRGLSRKSQRGGNVAKPVSLKTAVGLLRQYYAEKYN